MKTKKFFTGVQNFRASKFDNFDSCQKYHISEAPKISKEIFAETGSFLSQENFREIFRTQKTGSFQALENRSFPTFKLLRVRSFKTSKFRRTLRVIRNAVTVYKNISDNRRFLK